ncbi:MAG TPA: hypothetical protein DCW90_16940 [Lachnospiraceae bacterium]|nr:hypothetical protein [uncultured Lachnoclostridium sp.]HAU87105.1 hypothetical protein [Lachnospiraceae bacterium]
MNHNICKLDLKEYFNHKFIVGKGEQELAKEHLENVNEYGLFQPQLLPESNADFEVEGVQFVFPNKAIDMYDSIQCEGQCIGVETRPYKKIHIIGTAVNNDFIYEELYLRNEESGVQNEAPLLMKDFYYLIGNTKTDYDTYYDCRGAEGYVAYDSMNESIKRGMYYCESNISMVKEVNTIELPYNPDLYIFCITLEW